MTNLTIWVEADAALMAISVMHEALADGASIPEAIKAVEASNKSLALKQ